MSESGMPIKKGDSFVLRIDGVIRVDHTGQKVYCMSDGTYRTIDDLKMLSSIVHCRECMYWHDQEYGYVEIPICERLCEKYTGLKGGQFIPMGADDYCSMGKRK